MWFFNTSSIVDSQRLHVHVYKCLQNLINRMFTKSYKCSHKTEGFNSALQQYSGIVTFSLIGGTMGKP